MRKAFLVVFALVAIVLLILVTRTAFRSSGSSDLPSSSASSLGPSLALETLGTPVAVGDTVLVNVVAKDVKDVFGVQLSVRYDGEVLSFVRADEQAFLGRQGADRTMLMESVLDGSTPGLVKDFVLVKLGGEGTSGSGVVATLAFTARSAGTARLELVDVIVADKEAKPLVVGSVGTTVSVD